MGKNKIVWVIPILAILSVAVFAQGHCPSDPPTPTPWPIQPTYTFQPTYTPRPTYTATATVIPTETCRPTNTPRVDPSPTPYPTYTPLPTNTPYPITPTVTMTAMPVVGLPAFPGAEGFGANTVGGRGGRVIEVTNLNDSGIGSLRDCIEVSGPRICVFRVAGTIDLYSTIDIRNPYITIAGQTAPRGGITLRCDGYQRAPINIYTNDVVVRFLRIRPGPGPLNTTSPSGDGLNILSANAYNIVLDHLSVSWATDENICSWYGPGGIKDGPTDFTVQWCLIGEPLRCSTNSHPTDGGTGLLAGSESTGNVSIHHNLFVTASRNPGIQSGRGTVDIVNNVSWWSWRSSVAYPIPVNYVGNYLQDRHTDPVTYNPIGYYINVASGVEVFVQGNISEQRPTNDLPDELAIMPSQRSQITPARHDAPSVTTYSCNAYADCEAKDKVLFSAGANLGLDSQGNFYRRRDAVDKRLVEWIEQFEGRKIDAPCEALLVVGRTCKDGLVPNSYLASEDYTKHGIYDPLDGLGWPLLDDPATFPYEAYADADHDGMADEWEIIHFGTMDRGSPDDSSGDYDNDGYTDLEEFLNGSNPA